MPKHTTDTASNSIGTLLKAAREQRGMSPAEAASQLNLKVVIIEKLESEQWDNSMATTFVKGYLRAYARLLKLSEREILQAYDLQTAHLRGQQTEMHSFSRKTSREAADSRFMLATYGIVVLLVGLFFVWFWQTHMLDSEPVAVLPDYVAPTAESAAADTSGLSATPPVTDVPSPQTAAVQDSLSTSPAPAAATTQSVASTPVEAVTVAGSATNGATEKVATERTATTDTATTAPATVIEQVAEDLPASSIETTEGETPQRTSTSQNPVQPNLTPAVTTTPSATVANDASSASTDIQVSFSADCWVSITDSQQQKLAYGLQKAGTTLQLRGQYPVKMIIGNAAAASITVQGKPYDLSQYQAGQVARITLTGAQ